MNLIELNRSLVQLRLSGVAAVLETRLLQAQSEAMAPIDLISILVSDELACRSKRLLERRHKQAQFRDRNKQIDNFDFQFNPKMNRSLVFDLATAAWIGRREDALFLGPAGSGKSHCAQAIGPCRDPARISRDVSRSPHPARVATLRNTPQNLGSTHC
jgi:DNA replication protein DnaC